MKGKTLIVTGGAGFIGSNLARFLVNAGNQVTVIDDLSTGRRENIQGILDDKNFRFMEGSITDLSLLHECFQNVDGVFHEAALASVPRSIKNPVATNLVNIGGTLNVLVAAKDAGVKKVVCASSSSVYGDTPTLPKKESMELHPLSPYAVSKLAGEYYSQVFADVFHLPTVSLRYFNVYGPFQDPSSEYAAVIPKFFQNVLNDKPPVVYGDGTQTRDFTFIDDVVQANIRAMESPATGVFNAAGGKCITINDLAETIMRLCRKKMDIVYEAARPGDIKDSLADCSKAKASFGYHPKYDITSGLKETVSWYQKLQ